MSDESEKTPSDNETAETEAAENAVADGETAEPAKEPVSSARIGSATAARKRAAARKRRTTKQGSPTRNIMLFVLVIVGTAATFGVIGNSVNSGGRAKAKWKIGQTASISLTVVTRDHRDLQCAMKDAIKGLDCMFEAENKPNARVTQKSSRKNGKLLQPYTTTDGANQIMAAGLWVQPPLKAKIDKENWKLPSPRFSVKCKYKVEGLAKKARVRWKSNGAWHNGHNWYVGELSNCKIE
jgi:hypothetical protein